MDWSLRNGLADIPIEQRVADEVHYLRGLDEKTGEVRGCG